MREVQATVVARASRIATTAAALALMHEGVKGLTREQQARLAEAIRRRVQAVKPTSEVCPDALLKRYQLAGQQAADDWKGVR